MRLLDLVKLQPQVLHQPPAHHGIILEVCNRAEQRLMRTALVELPEQVGP